MRLPRKKNNFPTLVKEASLVTNSSSETTLVPTHVTRCLFAIAGGFEEQTATGSIFLAANLLGGGNFNVKLEEQKYYALSIFSFHRAAVENWENFASSGLALPFWHKDSSSLEATQHTTGECFRLGLNKNKWIIIID